MTTYRPVEKADFPALAELSADRFGHPIPPEEWEWKYRRLPGESRSWVATDADGRLLAHSGALCLPARIGQGRGERDRGTTGGLWQLTDFMGTARGSGLRPPLVKLGRRLLADLPRPGDAPWIYGFPSDRHFGLGRRVFGYRPLPSVEPLAGSIPAGAEAAEGAVELNAGESCGDWAEAVWEAVDVLGIRRSAAFLNWRYHARPGRYYRFYRLRAEGRVGATPTEGLAVFAFVGREAWAAELWLPPAGWSASSAEAALSAVAADLRAAGLDRWVFWPPPDARRPEAPGACAAALAALGLAATGETVEMGCRGPRGATAGPPPADPRFYYSMGDYDLV